MRSYRVTTDEKELMKHFCCGDRGAYEAFYALYGKRIYRFCHRLCAHNADAEDLTQEVFLAAFQGRQRFQGRSSVTTWLYRIALYQWRARYEAKGKQILPLPEVESEALSVSPISSVLLRLTLDRAMASLSDGLRETFILVKAEGFTCAEAADILEIPAGTVKYRIHEATRRLREMLTTEMGSEERMTPDIPLLEEVVHEM
jgi:RNA polymerase sigma-70 factor, ECF subfamily